MGTTDTIRRIEKDLGVSETYRVTTFKGIRENADGRMQEITLELLDGDKDAQNRRYAVNIRFLIAAGGQREGPRLHVAPAFLPSPPLRE